MKMIAKKTSDKKCGGMYRRKENSEFKVSVRCIVRPCPKRREREREHLSGKE
jgi:hypothetical protein